MSCWQTSLALVKDRTKDNHIVCGDSDWKRTSHKATDWCFGCILYRNMKSQASLLPERIQFLMRRGKIPGARVDPSESMLKNHLNRVLKILFKILWEKKFYIISYLHHKWQGILIYDQRKEPRSTNTLTVQGTAYETDSGGYKEIWNSKALKIQQYVTK